MVLSRCSYVCFDDIDDAQQLFDECNNNPTGSNYRPTEVERLVELGANGSGYKHPRVRLPLVSSFSIVLTSLFLSPKRTQSYALTATSELSTFHTRDRSIDLSERFSN